jgi:GrpB-like predicted nucleotidyltransferase (UPF0157 family)
MPASRSVVSMLVRELGDISLHPQGRPTHVVLAGLVEAILVNPVGIADYDASWPAAFQQLRDRLAATLGPLAVAIEQLRPLGYLHEGDLGVPGREAFTTPAGAPPHHLYVCAIGTPALNRHLAFRDALRSDPDVARAYGDLKRALAARLGDDRAGYTEAKSAFIEQVLAAMPRRP